MKEWKRIVIKLGTNVLTDSHGHMDQAVLNAIVTQICSLKQKGKEIVLISSGAVGTGKSQIKLNQKLNDVTQRQVYSAIGQIELMRNYQMLFKQNGIMCAQVLSTKEDFRDRVHFINMKRCLLALMRDDILPIVNENDVTSISELMFTDNDELAGLSASLVNADTLVILTNVDGVYSDFNKKVIIQKIKPGNKSIYQFITGEKSSFGRGGMMNKLSICQNAAKMGIQCYIGNGKVPNILEEMELGVGKFTYIIPSKKKSGIKKWIAHSQSDLHGHVVINVGAEKIITDPLKIASVLPVGVISVEGSFKKGDLIGVNNEMGGKIAVGISNYSSEHLEEIAGYRSKRPVIHYNYLHII